MINIFFWQIYNNGVNETQDNNRIKPESMFKKIIRVHAYLSQIAEILLAMGETLVMRQRRSRRQKLSQDIPDGVSVTKFRMRAW